MGGGEASSEREPWDAVNRQNGPGVPPVPRYAHTADGPPETAWERLEDHLRRVAGGDASMPGARGFAAAFGAADWGELAGLWHDLGKYSDEFQEYLRRQQGIERANAHIETPGRVDHSTAGAQHAASKGPLGRLLAFCIAGHHGGMPDAIGPGSLEARLDKPVPELRDVPGELMSRALPRPPALRPAAAPADRSYQAAFFTRMLFSALVDADFLATESFMDSERRALRESRPAPTIEALRPSSRRFFGSPKIAQQGRARPVSARPLQRFLERVAPSRGRGLKP